MGDAMADWLAYGLEEALAEKPEIGVIRKHRTTSGLIRYEPSRDSQWAQVARNIISQEKPAFIVMMIGMNDRRPIRVHAGAPAASERGKGPPTEPTPRSAQLPRADAELQAQEPADQQNAELQDQTPPGDINESARSASTAGTFEFHTENWEAAYVKRIDATMAALKSGGTPVLWVGLPPQRSRRATSDSAYLNELFRQRAEKAGIIYVDVWDGFVTESGRFIAQGPDVEGQTRRLRSGDGVYFTKAGARKLAHYVDREIDRLMAHQAITVAVPRAPAGLRSGAGNGSGTRPLAGPVIPLTTLPPIETNELFGGGQSQRPPTYPGAPAVLLRGESPVVPPGRADDFRWPREDVVNTATGPVLSPTADQSSLASTKTLGTAQRRSLSSRRASRGGVHPDDDRKSR